MKAAVDPPEPMPVLFKKIVSPYFWFLLAELLLKPLTPVLPMQRRLPDPSQVNLSGYCESGQTSEEIGMIDDVPMIQYPMIMAEFSISPYTMNSRHDFAKTGSTMSIAGAVGLRLSYWYWTTSP